MIGRFTWRPDARQLGDAVRMAVADPDCDVMLKRIKIKDTKNMASRHIGQAVDRVVDAEGTELEQDEVKRRIAPYVVTYPGTHYHTLPSVLLKHWSGDPYNPAPKPKPRISSILGADGRPLQA